MPHRASDECEIRQIDEIGPRLSVEPRRLLRDRKMFIGQRPVKRVADPRGIRAVGECRLREASSVDANSACAERRETVVVRHRLHRLIDLAHDVGFPGIRIHIDGHSAFVVDRRRLFEVSVVETGNSERMAALPDGDVLVALNLIRGQVADRHNLVLAPLRNPEGQFEVGGVAERADVRIPALPRTDGEVPVARIVQDLLPDAVIRRFEEVLRPDGQSRGKDHRRIGIFVRVLLNERHAGPRGRIAGR